MILLGFCLGVVLMGLLVYRGPSPDPCRACPEKRLFCFVACDDVSARLSKVDEEIGRGR